MSQISFIFVAIRKYNSFAELYYANNDRHHLPHFHARYQGYKAAIAIEDGRVLAGNLPSKQLKLVQAWIELHRDKLIVNWDLVVNDEEPFRIAPLQ
jgi:hypothetical protein